MYDRKRTHSTQTLERSVATGQTILQEGAVLVAIEQSGEQVTQVSAGAADETIIGFSMIDNYTPATRTVVAAGSVPSAAAYMVTLSHSNLVAGQIRIYDDTTGSALTEGNAANPTEYSVVDSTGVITFNAARADDSITVTYKYNLTVNESIMLYGERHSNAGASAFLEQVTVITGAGEIYTDQYDVSVTYEGLAVGALKSAASGLISTAGTGTAFGVVVHAPDVNDPFLGIAFNVANVLGA